MLLITILVSCGGNSALQIHDDHLQGQTFSITSQSFNDTLIIDFQDSTYKTIGSIYVYEGHNPWKIRYDQGGNFLILNNKVFGIDKTDGGSYKCTLIGIKDHAFSLQKRKQKWTKNQLSGIWVQKEMSKIYDDVKNGRSKLTPPPAPPGVTSTDYHWPFFYDISVDSIKYHEYYTIYQSKIEFNNSNEYLIMETGDEYMDEQNRKWHIKSLTDTQMIVNRFITSPFGETEVIDTLVKKKRS